MKIEVKTPQNLNRRLVDPEETDGEITDDGQENIWEETVGENYSQPWRISLAFLDCII